MSAKEEAVSAASDSRSSQRQCFEQSPIGLQTSGHLFSFLDCLGLVAEMQQFSLGKQFSCQTFESVVYGR
ncbi:hypothetical protein [Sphingobium phenoxybenzoativorans]|uniref:hypothetical protein n=1 Tax=Sphingobium phenoxybenzoativorans TaxID=1592790 RepID=UPI00087254AC|nr:hypothetical protein [Sphingobium phenoxybenzoativorans]